MLIEIEETYAWDFKYELKYEKRKITGESVCWQGDDDFEDIVLNENGIPTGWMVDENGEITDNNEEAVDFLPNEEFEITIFDVQPRVGRGWASVKY